MKPKAKRPDVIEWWHRAQGRGSPSWAWHLLAPNGEILCHAEGYASKANLNRAIKRMQGRLKDPAVVRELVL